MQAQPRIVDLPKRRTGAHGSKWKSFSIDTNYFPVIVSNMKEINVYKVVFEPKIPADNTKERLRLLNIGLPQIKNYIRNPVLSSMNIYSNQENTLKGNQDINVENFKITFKHVKRLPVEQNQNVLFAFLNIAFKNVMRKLQYTEIGKTRKFFTSQKSQQVDNALKIFSGYQANFLIAENSKFYLRVDPARKVVRSEKALGVINGVYTANKHKQRDQKRNLVKQALVGKIVMLDYGNQRYIRVDDIIFSNVDQYCLKNSETTLRQFYRKKYNIQIENPKQPLIASIKKQGEDPDIFIPELCLMTGIPDDFDEFKRKKVSEKTIRSSGEKKCEIQQLMNKVSKEEEFAALSKIGVDLKMKMKSIEAKIIPSPTLRLGDNKSVERGRQANFQLFANPIFKSKYKIKLGFVHTRRANVRPVFETFKNTSMKLKVELNMIDLDVGEVQLRKTKNALLSMAEKAIKNEGCNALLIAIPSPLKNEYKSIKNFCLLQNEIISQVVVESTLAKKNAQSIATKLLLQIIAKVGNTLWVPEITVRDLDCMIVGFDSSKSGKENVLSCCGTVNSTFSSMYSCTTTFSQSEDKLKAMKGLLKKTIDYYYQRNQSHPREIIIFQNSCSNDQIKMYQHYFISPIKDEFVNVSNPPKLTFVMINTKTNERFFAYNRDTVKNVDAGTLISNTIVSQNYDFYMVPQFSNRGSSVPNHCKVIYTDSIMQEGILQEIIYSQCFNYVNWTGSIKIPGVLQYAKKCSRFGSDTLSGSEVVKELETKLYYI